MIKDIPLSGQELDEIARQAIEITKRTGAHLAKNSISFVSQKEGHANFVTDMDVKVQEMLVTALTPLLPGASFLLEEDDAPPSLSDFVWIIDPIDGTQNFISGNRQSAISIGLFYKTTGLLGIVCNPFLDELYTAVRGQGAFLNGRVIHVSEKPLANAVICAGTALYYEELHDKYIRAVTRLLPLCGDFRRFGSAALEICYTACGKCDGFFEYRLCPWDYAGACVILQEAGGYIAPIEHEILDCRKKSGIIAGGKTVFEELRKIV